MIRTTLTAPAQRIYTTPRDVTENAELRMQRDVLKRSTALWVAEATGRTT